ncbi:MAG: thioredoxin family protein [Candidatus Hodarchaeales archaeon]|jgi:thioredoxin-like negative regulator of GroEL
MDIIDVTTLEQFKGLLNAHKIVFADFWAEWCHPCRILGKTYEEMKNEVDPDIDVIIAKVDTETDNEELKGMVMQLQISSIPSVFVFINSKLLAFKDQEGNTMDRIVGVRPKEVYMELIDHLEKIETEA